MDYDRLFAMVCRHLQRHGVACEILAGEPATARTLRKAEDKMKVRLPADLRQFYQPVGDGLSFQWEADPNDSKAPFASLRVPSLAELARTYIGWRQYALYSPEQAEDYGFPHTDDPALAKRTAARMWHWLPVIEEGNGDLICVDLGDPSCPVIFNNHSWMDGGSGDNGHVLAPSWPAFLTAWGSVCFQFPKGVYWPACFRSGGGVAWDGERFREPFRIPGLVDGSLDHPLHD